MLFLPVDSHTSNFTFIDAMMGMWGPKKTFFNCPMGAYLTHNCYGIFTAYRWFQVHFHLFNLVGWERTVPP